MLAGKKLFLLGLCITAAVAATAPATAAAEETPHFIKGGKEVTEELRVNGTITSFFLRVPALGYKFLCEGIDNKASIGAKWKSKLTIEFTKCTVYTVEGEEIPQCKVMEPVKIELLDQLIYKGGKKGEEIYDVFYGASSKKFTGLFSTIKFEGEDCAIAGTNAIKGSAVGLPTPKKPGEEAEVFKLKFMGETALSGNYLNRENETVEKAGELKFGSSAASLEGEVKLELLGKEKFGGE
jgi:hypothetical protein